MRLLLLWSFAVSFRKTALNSDCIWIFYDFIHARGGGGGGGGGGRGGGGGGSNGVNLEHHRKLLSL